MSNKKLYPIKDIISFYNKTTKFVFEDSMNDKFEKGKYKGTIKLLTLNEAKKPTNQIAFFIDISEWRLIANTIIRYNSLNVLFNDTEKAFNLKPLAPGVNLTPEQSNMDVPVYKNIKGTKYNNRVVSRVLTIAEGKNGKFLIRISEHEGKETNNGAIIPISKAFNSSYFVLNLQEISMLAYDSLDYIHHKEAFEFEKYHVNPSKYFLNNNQEQYQLNQQPLNQSQSNPFEQYSNQQTVPNNNHLVFADISEEELPF